METKYKLMSWKEFLKPTKPKLIFMLVLITISVVSTVLFYCWPYSLLLSNAEQALCTFKYSIWNYSNPEFSVVGKIIGIITDYAQSELTFTYSPNVTLTISVILLIVNIGLSFFIYFYLLPCFIIWIYNKIKQKK